MFFQEIEKKHVGRDPTLALPPLTIIWENQDGIFLIKWQLQVENIWKIQKTHTKKDGGRETKRKWNIYQTPFTDVTYKHLYV
jgi:hypothetical protein